ncbi:hypothetical protein AZE42_10290 [Rhizopogon vesiculosus]|uniref:BHLH domain-containing protein n=1 Tax=Rhizopogon vesiculosus TaxID=180088 RepID=A0A1J8REZ1_9AGAM|nr:hypothetical protein AZE42_10290 [Rhizopogon vesiculosus]
MSPLKPILPLDMVRAKRLRSDSSPTIPDNQRLSSPMSSDYQAEDDAYDALPPPPQPRRRGRKPGSLSRAAREAQRKTNHSLIEKARRTKINDALATLRELVPPEYKRANEAPEHSDDEDDEPKKSKGKSKPGEKEFKLEILVRTVAYLQDLTEKVKQLEENGCPNCKHPICPSSYDIRPSKRRRQDFESNQVDEEEGARTNVTSPHHPPSRLPSISTWLPPSSERRTLLLTPSQSPSCLPVPISSKPALLQLPTPPTSVTFAPSIFGAPPLLTLPSPSTFLPTSSGKQIQPCFSGFIPRRTSSDPSSSTSSPMYSPEDETAASLLLRISTSSSSPHLPPKQASPSVEPHDESVHALTPSRLLGLTARK